MPAVPGTLDLLRVVFIMGVKVIISMQPRRNNKMGSVVLALTFLVGLVWFIILYHVPVLFSIVSLKFIHPISTSFMNYKSLLKPEKGIRYEWVDSKNISKYLKDAVIIAEDDRFFEHPGVDWIAIKTAARKNWKKKRFAYGGSTISQQLVKNLYLSPSKDPLRKIREVLLALLIDNYLSKERILEIYLNVVEWGPNVFGVKAATEHYFKGSPKYLSAPQAAFLASILPNPNKLGRRGYYLSGRAQRILNRIQ